jgi:transcriptional regulator GlxA family with amidase domain
LSVSDFDAWRARTSNEDCLATLVDQLASDRVAALSALPPQLQLALSWLRHQPSVPPLKAFAEAACARRSFFRLWARSMRERPGKFLDHLRALHAEKLLAQGATVEETLRDVGCSSLPALRRLLDRWH